MTVLVSRTPLLSRTAMALSRMWLLFLCAAVLTALGAPFNINKDNGKMMEEVKEKLKMLKEMPGLDEEEYLRYWKEAVKNDPSMFVLILCTYIRTYTYNIRLRTIQVGVDKKQL